MNASNAVNVEYVTKEVFDETIQRIESKIDYQREITDSRFEKMLAIMEKNSAELKLEIKNLDMKIDAGLDSLNMKIDTGLKILDMKIDKLDDTLSISIMGTNERIDSLEKRFEDMKEFQNKWFTVFGILFSVAAVVAPVTVALIQYFLSK